MSYVVLARKYRPQTFEELIGQDHITKILAESIETKRLGSAYLFSGPRGVGKTSCARILAKSLNCQKGPTLSPCGSCPACKEIAQATSFDVIEIDGASNRGIDEIRTLRENVKFAPSYGRFKIYIVDEVHMLTTEAFNALLKTLEEPPEHVKFIFATTAPSKVPATIVSRCQRFDFKRISIDTMTKALNAVCAKEKLKVDTDALFAIAKAASGSLRDSLSILDQLGALSQRAIKIDDVTSMLGTVEIELLFELSGCIAKKDCAATLKVFDQIVERGKDIKQLNRDLIEHFRNLMVIKVGGKALGSLVDYPVTTKEILLTQAENFSLREIIEAIEALMDAQESARIMDSLRIPIEVAFAKLTQHNPTAGEKGKPQSTASASGAQPKTSAKSAESSRPSPFGVLTNQKGQVDFSKSESEEKKEDLTLGVSEPVILAGQISLEQIRQAWDAITHAISRERMSVATFLQEGSPLELNGEKLVISFPPESAFHKESLENKDSLRLVERVFSEKLRMNLVISFKIVENHKPQDNEPLIKGVLDAFQGKVVNKWHND